MLQFPNMALRKTNEGLVAAPIVKRKLSDHVLDRLKAMITSGEYPPGHALPSERELMASYGVGRPAIREAMQALANVGLITIKHGERARVRPLSAKAAVDQIDLVAQLMLSASPTMLENLKDARRFFERGMVREAAQKADAGDIEELERLVEEQAAVVGDAEAFIAADRRFHGKIAAISRNAIFDAVSEAMLGWLRDHRAEPSATIAQRRLALQEHAAIVDSIKARDPDAAEAALLRYLDPSDA
ncbi:MAG TPA: transcriptional regulator NanR [Caulobacter sp.]|nr:transcriptional regulator NanR [Caulobacter sp.]